MKTIDPKNLIDYIQQAIDNNANAKEKNRYFMILSSGDDKDIDGYFLNYDNLLLMKDEKQAMTENDCICLIDLYNGQLVSIADAIQTALSKNKEANQ